MSLAPNLFLHRQAGVEVVVLSDANPRGRIATVLCRHCESKPVRERRRSALVFEPTERASPGLRECLCDACGSVLPACEPDEFLLRRLSLFARFGIGAESAPLLTDPSRVD